MIRCPRLSLVRHGVGMLACFLLLQMPTYGRRAPLVCLFGSLCALLGFAFQGDQYVFRLKTLFCNIISCKMTC